MGAFPKLLTTYKSSPSFTPEPTTPSTSNTRQSSDPTNETSVMSPKNATSVLISHPNLQVINPTHQDSLSGSNKLSPEIPRPLQDDQPDSRIKSALTSPETEINRSRSEKLLPQSKRLLSKSEILRGREIQPKSSDAKLQAEAEWAIAIGTKDETIDPNTYENRKNRSNRSKKPLRYEDDQIETTPTKKRPSDGHPTFVKKKKSVERKGGQNGSERKLKSVTSTKVNPRSKSELVSKNTTACVIPTQKNPDNTERATFTNISNIKRAYGKNNKRPRDPLQQLLENASWLASFDECSQPDGQFSGVSTKRQRGHPKNYHLDSNNHKDEAMMESDDEDKHLILRRQKGPSKKKHEEHIKKEEEDSDNNNNKLRILEESRKLEQAHKATENNRIIETKEILVQEYKSERHQKFMEEIARVRRRGTKGTKYEVKNFTSKTPIEDEYGCKEEYIPFLHNVVVGNYRRSIKPSMFFTESVCTGNVSEVKSIPELTIAKKLMSSQSRQYQYNKDYPPPPKDSFEIRSCIYPNFSESYLTKETSSHLGLDTFLEVGRIMEFTAESYIPPKYKKLVFNSQAPLETISGRYALASKDREWKIMFKEIENYNNLIDEIHKNGEFLPHIQSLQRFSRVSIHEILNQVYTRSVLPEANILRQYKGFSAEVYGELMPVFVSELFELTGMNSSSVFMDLGSGVGNVTLGAALEFGAESYGCELMENCTKLADKQLKEFKARTQLYGIRTSHVELLKGDFTTNKRVLEVLPRCDVILVNNYLFDSKLNEKVLDLLSCVKLGTRIISLKPVVPDAFTYCATDDNTNDYISRMKVEKHEFRKGSVSWSNCIGNYYITELTDNIQVTKEKKNTRLQRNKTTAVERAILTPVTSDFEDICEALEQEIYSNYVPEFSDEAIIQRIKLDDEKREEGRLRLAELGKIKEEKRLQKTKELERKRKIKLKKENDQRERKTQELSSQIAHNNDANGAIGLAVTTLGNSSEKEVFHTLINLPS